GRLGKAPRRAGHRDRVHRELARRRQEPLLSGPRPAPARAGHSRHLAELLTLAAWASKPVRAVNCSLRCTLKPSAKRATLNEKGLKTALPIRRRLIPIAQSRRNWQAHLGRTWKSILHQGQRAEAAGI